MAHLLQAPIQNPVAYRPPRDSNRDDVEPRTKLGCNQNSTAPPSLTPPSYWQSVTLLLLKGERKWIFCPPRPDLSCASHVHASRSRGHGGQQDNRPEKSQTGVRAPRTIPFRTILLLESVQPKGSTGAHEDLPHLPADLLR